MQSSATLRDLGLTPGHMRALLVLEPGTQPTMGALAQAFHCDASTVTWLVDRLEERGLVERRSLARDRRVKAIALTPDGVKMKQLLEQRFFEVPPAFGALDRSLLQALRSALVEMDNDRPPAPR